MTFINKLPSTAKRTFKISLKPQFCRIFLVSIQQPSNVHASPFPHPDQSSK